MDKLCVNIPPETHLKGLGSLLEHTNSRSSIVRQRETWLVGNHGAALHYLAQRVHLLLQAKDCEVGNHFVNAGRAMTLAPSWYSHINYILFDFL